MLFLFLFLPGEHGASRRGGSDVCGQLYWTCDTTKIFAHKISPYLSYTTFLQGEGRLPRVAVEEALRRPSVWAPGVVNNIIARIQRACITYIFPCFVCVGMIVGDTISRTSLCRHWVMVDMTGERSSRCRLSTEEPRLRNPSRPQFRVRPVAFSTGRYPQPQGQLRSTARSPFISSSPPH